MPLMTGIIRSMEQHYNKLVKVNCNTCDVGTWAINKSAATTQQPWGTQMKSFFARFKKNTNDFVPCSTNTATAYACSASDDTSTQTRTKILVVCKCPAFSEEMMHYAATMASRTKSEIVALSLDEKENDFDQFRTQSQHNIGRFAQEAKNRGLTFSHLIFNGQEENVLDTLYAQDQGYRYVMDDMPALMGKTHSIPVYSRVSLRVS